MWLVSTLVHGMGIYLVGFNRGKYIDCSNVVNILICGSWGLDGRGGVCERYK